MFKFSERSTRRLNSCHPDLVRLFNEVIKNYDCTILEGHRSDERQEELYHEGKSKLRAGQSKHNKNPSLAVDVAPYPIRWNEPERFYHFAGFVLATAIELDINIRFGGDWDGDNDFNDQTFFDLPHFELV